ncbi:MAG: hypothetical protein H7070_07140 [Saprospiraceae bacterium]|nr:hypothetical protein [Pyrinomonadaceae bacterium]
MAIAKSKILDLPDADSAQRFLTSFAEKHHAKSERLLKNDALLSDVLALVSFSPLLATTLLQNPEYLWWLDRNRIGSGVRNKSELLESLARFSLTNSQIEPHILLARFRRRELLRIFLSDIRRLSTIAETTEEISNLADAILENALRLARQELDNRYGAPLEIDGKGREKPAEFCIVSLGKLGSRELNYSSDIDLLFIYSGDGSTSGSGSRGQITNREYFVKLSGSISQFVGRQSGEGAAYRVDMRLRPHGRVGSLALSAADTIRYYRAEAADWERQVLVRSRSSAGDSNVYKKFFAAVEDSVFSKGQTVEKALRGVRLSKEKIDLQNRAHRGYDVKLGKGGIREIEFIAQALQLAYGGGDKWLRVPHTLKSLARLADRKLLSESELTGLFDAYEFLRHLEHILQMENGLQTHTVPDETVKRSVVSKRMSFSRIGDFESSLAVHAATVNSVFVRVFGTADHEPLSPDPNMQIKMAGVSDSRPKKLPPQLLDSLQRSGADARSLPAIEKRLGKLTETSPRLVEMISANPGLIENIPGVSDTFDVKDYASILKVAVASKKDFRSRIGVLRREWTQFLLNIIAFDVYGKLSLQEVKGYQTALAEASVETAFLIARSELEKHYSVEIGDLELAVMGLGKLGGAGLDYDSDLDLVFVYDETKPLPVSDITHAQFYGRAVEIIITALSSVTRDGSLYRVDLRLRPHGKNGETTISKTAFRQYMRNDAAVWELLAYVKIRGVGSDPAKAVEREIKDAIHKRAAKIDIAELADESRRVRSQLEKERSASRRGKEIDIKFGSGGMLDIYFAIRFLQLRYNVPDDDESRSTGETLAKLLANNSLSSADHENLYAGYQFLSALDHNIRLTAGRSTRVPLANQNALRIIAKRMDIRSGEKLIEDLTLHRLNIRASYENILNDDPSH